MDFLDPAKKRKRGIKLFIGYILVGIAIGLAALILIFLAYGYSLDSKTGTVIQNGIVFVSSRPSAAQIIFNGTQFKDVTDARAILPSGDYKLEIQKEGYRSWQRSFYLSGGSIERFIYPRLFPNEIKTTSVTTYRTAPALSTQSPDRRWLVVQQTATAPRFEVYDLDQAAPVAEQITIPSSVVSAGTRSFELVEWSNNNRHVLLKHNYGKKAEFILLDREKPNESINVTKLTKGSFNAMSLRDKKFDQWYLHNTAKQQLFLATRNDPSPRLLIEDVVSYKSHGTDVILYATAAKAPKGKTRIIIWDEGRADELRQVAAGKRYLLDVAQFEGKWFFAVGSARDGKIYVYEDPFTLVRSQDAAVRQTLTPATIMRLEGAEFISFSQNARFISVQAGSEFALFDAETNRTYRYDSKLSFAKSQKAVWMDGHRLMAVIDGKVEVFDYDGINRQTLLASVENALPLFSNDYEKLYTIQPKANSKEADLVRGDLLIAE